MLFFFLQRIPKHTSCTYYDISWPIRNHHRTLGLNTSVLVNTILPSVLPSSFFLL
ncbi:hypothetical protein HMI55_004513, partial [Coelomomyces lativittatus]